MSTSESEYEPDDDGWSKIHAAHRKEQERLNRDLTPDEECQFYRDQGLGNKRARMLAYGYTGTHSRVVVVDPDVAQAWLADVRQHLAEEERQKNQAPEKEE